MLFLKLKYLITHYSKPVWYAYCYAFKMWSWSFHIWIVFSEPSISETINRAIMWCFYISLKGSDAILKSKLTDLPALCQVCTWGLQSGTSIPEMFLSPSNSPILIASVLSPDQVSLLFLNNQSHISADSFQRTSIFSSTRDLNSVGKVSFTGCNHWEWQASII